MSKCEREQNNVYELGIMKERVKKKQKGHWIKIEGKTGLTSLYATYYILQDPLSLEKKKSQVRHREFQKKCRFTVKSRWRVPQIRIWPVCAGGGAMVAFGEILFDRSDDINVYGHTMSESVPERRWYGSKDPVVVGGGKRRTAVIGKLTKRCFCENLLGGLSAQYFFVIEKLDGKRQKKCKNQTSDELVSNNTFFPRANPGST